MDKLLIHLVVVGLVTIFAGLLQLTDPILLGLGTAVLTLLVAAYQQLNLGNQLVRSLIMGVLIVLLAGPVTGALPIPVLSPVLVTVGVILIVALIANWMNQGLTAPKTEPQRRAYPTR